MQITYFRSSSIGTWNLCPHQYFLSYVLGVPQHPNIKAERGTCVHKVLELLACCKQELDKAGGIVSINDEAVGKLSTSRNGMFDKDFISYIIDNVYNYYSSKSPNTFTKKDYEMVSTSVWKVLNFSEGMFDPRKRDILAPEAHFDFEIKEDWAKIGDNQYLRVKGTIDLITKIRDGFAELVDWKTGVRKDWSTGEEKTYIKFTKDIQLRLYHLAIHHLFPDLKQVMVTIFYINDGGPFSVPFDKTDIEATLTTLRTKFEEVKNCKIPSLKGGGKHWFCERVCSYGKTHSGKDDCNQCQYYHQLIVKNGIEKVIKDHTASGHSIDVYHNPGE